MLTIRLHGHHSAAFGLADGAAATARCLEAAGCAVIRCNLRLNSHPTVPSGLPAREQPAVAGGSVQVDLVHTNPNVLEASPDLLNPAELSAPLRIAFWAWELEDFPEGWQNHTSFYNEIWCPSAYCAQSLSRRCSVPVIALPHLPDWQRLDALYEQRCQQPRPQPEAFRFLTLFDYWSTPERKNPAGAIAAFQAAFPLEQQDREPPVELLIKCSSAEQFPEQHAQLQALTQQDPRIHWIDQLLSREALDALFCRADALISLHRAEGFGLNLADAMAIGLPVVATGYSANLEFMPIGSAELIPWQTAAVPHNCGDYRRGQRWAEPDQAAAAAALRRLVHDAAHRIRLAQAGAHAVRERLATERLKAIVQQRLGRLLIHPHRHPDPPG